MVKRQMKKLRQKNILPERYIGKKAAATCIDDQKEQQDEVLQICFMYRLPLFSSDLCLRFVFSPKVAEDIAEGAVNAKGLFLYIICNEDLSQIDGYV